ncbi:hypothetical protein [Actinoalloteichus hymeniacidonis]|uniref:Uncharacterized protein n=1 Tax=Actinoalloteichus hymeniacidonis TaxID=340345 RepID=A0AAC9HTM9_9PSEU|nr:hypothetical protein [Actinoalloteichus hymeniacidonis]AOS65228.1 hypothetical protein TL08_22230 [Actinoalloteichus hymeniacidonis]MBB5906692.1 hypothetical protein [Actinoalloteichus hymeniacidonis]
MRTDSADSGQDREPNWLPKAWFALGVIGVLGLAVIAGLLMARSNTGMDVVAGQRVELPEPANRPRQGDPVEPTLSPDVLAHPDQDAIRVLVDTHFESINQLNYELWGTTVAAHRVEALPEQDWLESYRSTTDGNVIIHRIDPGPEDSLRMVLSFVSLQDPQDAPPEVPSDCVYWRVVYPLTMEDGKLKIDSGLPNSSIPSPCEQD